MSSSALQTPNLHPWAVVGGPSPGTITALAIARRDGHDGYTVFVGTRTGLYRTQWAPIAATGEVGGQAQPHWQRLPAAPLEIISLGLSPNYAKDATLLAGSAHGLFISRDSGEHWQAAHTPMSNGSLAAIVLCFCFSPNYSADGIILAGTLEDGVYYSDSRGARWSFRGFGLLDAAVYSLAISPDFAHDEIVFAGAESALYYSYNGARAWKTLDFSEDAAPVLSLALSPYLSRDQTLYAGTEHQGLHRSLDLGKTWQKTALPATCVNALATLPEDGRLFAAANSGLYSSADGGQRWTCLFDEPDVFSMAVREEVLIASRVDRGAWWRRRPIVSSTAGPSHSQVHPEQTSSRGAKADWCPFFTIPARSLTGMALSPRFDTDPVAFLYGPEEGIWRTLDGGRSWACLNKNLPGLAIHTVAVSPNFVQDRLLAVASADGLLISEDAGDHWTRLADEHFPGAVSLVVFSPAGKFVAANAPAGELWLADALGGPWRSASLPTGKGGQVLACAIDDDARLRVALLDPAQKMLSIWEGEPDQPAQLLARPAGPTPVVRFCIPSNDPPGAAWYASLDHQVWKFEHPQGKGPARVTLIFETDDGSRVLALTGSQTRSGFLLFACTGQAIYCSAGTNAWTVVHHFGNERAIALALHSAYPDEATAYALLLGGSFSGGTLKASGLL